MDARIFHNPQCSTSRTTLQRLRDAGVEPDVVQYLKTPPTRNELAQLISDAGLTPSQAVRRREALFSELSLADADDEALLDAMAQNPRLIERPFVVTAKGTRLARPVETVDEIL